MRAFGLYCYDLYAGWLYSVFYGFRPFKAFSFFFFFFRPLWIVFPSKALFLLVSTFTWAGFTEGAFVVLFVTDMHFLPPAARALSHLLVALYLRFEATNLAINSVQRLRRNKYWTECSCFDIRFDQTYARVAFSPDSPTYTGRRICPKVL